jgi:predicted small secreted protein
MKRVDGQRLAHLANGTAIIAIAAAAAMALTACSTLRSTGDALASAGHDVREATHLAPLGVDPSSPVAAKVEAAERTNAPIPSFASVPPKPTDVRAPEAYKSQVVDVVGARRALSRWEDAHPPQASDTEAFAEAQRAKVAHQKAVSESQEAESESFARKLRDAAGAPSAKPTAPPAANPTPPSAKKTKKAEKPAPASN